MYSKLLDTNSLTCLVLNPHIALYLQNKPLNISETVLMFKVNFQQFDIL